MRVRYAKRPRMLECVAIELRAAHHEHALDVVVAAGLVQRLGQRARREHALWKLERASGDDDSEAPRRWLLACSLRFPGPAPHDDRVALARGWVVGDRSAVGEVALELRPRQLATMANAPGLVCGQDDIECREGTKQLVMEAGEALRARRACPIDGESLGHGGHRGEPVVALRRAAHLVPFELGVAGTTRAPP